MSQAVRDRIPDFLYWLALPTLIVAELLGAGKHDSDNCRIYRYPRFSMKGGEIVDEGWGYYE